MCQESTCYIVVKEKPQQVKGPELAQKYFSIIFYVKLNTLLDLLDTEGQLYFLSMLTHGSFYSYRP